jgi:hypothetical protein
VPPSTEGTLVATVIFVIVVLLVAGPIIYWAVRGGAKSVRRL